jgi:hypothetical protein
VPEQVPEPSELQADSGTRDESWWLAHRRLVLRTAGGTLGSTALALAWPRAQDLVIAVPSAGVLIYAPYIGLRVVSGQVRLYGRRQRVAFVVEAGGALMAVAGIAMIAAGRLLWALLLLTVAALMVTSAFTYLCVSMQRQNIDRISKWLRNARVADERLLLGLVLWARTLTPVHALARLLSPPRRSISPLLVVMIGLLIASPFSVAAVALLVEAPEAGQGDGDASLNGAGEPQGAAAPPSSEEASTSPTAVPPSIEESGRSEHGGAGVAGPQGESLPQSELELTYEQQCGPDLPGSGAPEWAREALYDLFLGSGSGKGATVAGCAGHAQVVSDQHDTVAYVVGRTSDGALRSVAVASQAHGGTIFLYGVRDVALEWLEAGVAVGGSSRVDAGPAGDIQLLYTAEGTTSMLRSTKINALGTASTYILLGPAATELWIEEMQAVGALLWPSDASGEGDISLSTADSRSPLASMSQSDDGMTAQIERDGATREHLSTRRHARLAEIPI